MIKKSLLLAALAAIALNASAFAASAPECAACASPAKPRPVAASIVKPSGLPADFAGAVINVEFSLDQAGHPRDIQVLRVNNKVLKQQLVTAFSQWRFEPGVMDVATSSKRFILPVELKPEV